MSPHQARDAVRHDDAAAERALWAAVLAQAVHDATVPLRGGHGSGVVTATEQADAREFLTDPTRLAEVCEALDIDVHWFTAQLARRYPDWWATAPACALLSEGYGQATC